MGRSGGSKKRLQKKISSSGSITRSKSKTNIEANSGSVSEVPAQSISDAVIKSLEDGVVYSSYTEAHLNTLAEEGYKALSETGGFARGQAIVTALSPEISGSELAHAATRPEDLQAYLHGHGLVFSNDGRAFVSTEVTLRALASETGAEIIKEGNRDERRRPVGSQYLSAKYYLRDGQLLPSEDSYEITLDGENTLVEIFREEKDGKLETVTSAKMHPSSRKWDSKKGKWREDKTLRDYSESWEVTVTETEDEVRVALRIDAPAGEGKLPTLSASRKEIDAAGGTASWIEQNMERIIREDRQWEKDNPKKARKRIKAYHKRKKEEEEYAKRHLHQRHNPKIHGRNRTY